jgi:RimJ/RimL family protein N-acetyltransferase
MIAPLRPGVTLPQTDGPIIETERLILRRWREADIEPNTAMLADPAAARFITSDGKPITDAFVGWRNAAIMAGHWALHGAGMFVVEEKQTGRYVGRVGPWRPSGWPGFEIGWGIASGFRGRGYAVEAARGSIDWAFATFDIDQIIHCIDRENIASQGVARRLGAVIEREIDLFGHVADIWVTRREAWTATIKAQARRALLPPQMCRGRDPIEPLQ